MDEDRTEGLQEQIDVDQLDQEPILGAAVSCHASVLKLKRRGILN